MEKRNEPLLLRPAGKDYLWGGKRLNDEYGKNIELSPLAETWECSTHPDGVSTVRCGTFDKMELTAVIKAHPEYLGERHKGETTLPILVKLIDARKDLSVQVHPDDDYGYCLNTLHSYEFDGSAGFARMQSIMQAFRGGIKEFGGKKVVRLLDYVQGLDGLPKSDVLKFLLEDNCSLVVRPSGTEPKLKIYISVSAENKEMAEEVEDEIAKTAEKWIC